MGDGRGARRRATGAGDGPESCAGLGQEVCPGLPDEAYRVAVGVEEAHGLVAGGAPRLAGGAWGLLLLALGLGQPSLELGDLLP